MAFFISYAWAPVLTGAMRVPYSTDDWVSELMAERVVVSVVLSSLVMFGPLLVAGLRWRLPFGSATGFLVFLNLAIALGFDEELIALPAVAVAGLVFDLALAAGTDRRIIAGLPPAVLWSLVFATVGATDDGLGLAPEIWGGAIVLAALATMAVEGALEAGRRATIGDRPPGPVTATDPPVGVGR